jgi:hypothetical protein
VISSYISGGRRKFFSDIFCFLPLIIIAPSLHTHLPPPHDSPDQAALCPTFGHKLASSLTRHVAGLTAYIVLVTKKRNEIKTVEYKVKEKTKQ